MSKKSLKTQPRYCKICDKTLNCSKYNYESHLHSHGLKETRYKCEICFKEFYRKDLHDRHTKTHDYASRKLFFCDHCDRGYVDKRNLIQHLRIHDDVHEDSIVQFSCTACGACFCEKRLLVYHIRKNHFNLQHNKEEINNDNGEKWIEKVKNTNVFVEITKSRNNVLSIKKCKISNANADVKSELNFTAEYMDSSFAVSEKTQYSKAVCDYCKKEMLKKSLRVHIRERHLKIKRFKCSQCKINFNRHYQMVNHVCGKLRRRSRK